MFPLRIYTALKHLHIYTSHHQVCFPYEFTLLSNMPTWDLTNSIVCFPYEFTLLSNSIARCLIPAIVCFPYEFTLLSNSHPHPLLCFQFVSPTNLHCSQTHMQTGGQRQMFVSPTNLHCSQTAVSFYLTTGMFVSPTNLHCSQTSNLKLPEKNICEIFV